MLLSDSIDGFLYSMPGDGYSEVTIATYTRQIKQFLTCYPDKEIEDITTSDIRNFLAIIRKKGVMESTVLSYHRTLQSFFKWIDTEFDIPRPDLKVKRPKPASAEVQPFNQDEIQIMLKACDYTVTANTKDRKPFRMKRSTGLRDKFIILLLLDTGMRIGECCRLKIEDINLSTGEVAINPIGKGTKSKGRHVYMGKHCKGFAWRFMIKRKSDRPDSPLFLSINDKPLTINAAKHLLANLGKVTNIKHLHAHRFRHTFAIQFLRNGGDVFNLQRILGHSSLIMVKTYLQLANVDSQNAHKLASPVDNWHL